MRHVEFVAVVPPHYWHHSPFSGLASGIRYVTWDTGPVSNHLQGSSDPLGVEPITFYCFGPSKKPRQRDFLLLTLQQNLATRGGIEPPSPDRQSGIITII